jgi:hypothetical protein
VRIAAMIRDALLGRRTTDPFFGQLFFVSVPVIGRRGEPKPRGKFEYWEGCRRFGPTRREIIVQIVAGSSGPSEAQRVLYREIEARWEDLRTDLEKVLFSVFTDWFGSQAHFGELDISCPKDVVEVLDLVSILLDHPEPSEFQQFELTYAITDKHILARFSATCHELVVAFKDWKIVRAVFEG